MDEIRGYKAFTSELKCRDMQYEVGKQFTVEGELKACENGIHFCRKLKDVYNYYSKNYNTRVCEVICDGDYIEEGYKICARSIKLVRELTKDEIKSLTDRDWETLVL